MDYSIGYVLKNGNLNERGPFSFKLHSRNSFDQKKPIKFLWLSNVDSYKNGKGLDNLNKMTKYVKMHTNDLVAVLGGGNYAGNLQSDFGQRGLTFMDESEKLFSIIPFLPVVGDQDIFN